MKKNLLIVEDDSFLRSLLFKHFENQDEIGYAIIERGEDALQKAKELKPFLILLDIVLPDIDGYEVLKLLKDDPETRDIPVIVFSNLGQDSEKRRALDLGAERFLVKAEVDLDFITKLALERRSADK